MMITWPIKYYSDTETE